MRLSINKINTINISVPKEERLSYYINIIKYHDRWKSLNKKDFKVFFSDKKDNSKGFTSLKVTDYLGKRQDINDYNEKEKLFAKNELYLNKIISLTKENNIELILVKTPYVIEKDAQRKFNSVKEIASNNKINFIDFNLLYDEIGLDFEKDMYDKGHLNYIGSRKTSEYLSEYLENMHN